MGKTSFKEKLGYGIASMGDAVGYGLTSTFLLFFLTTIAGISPANAGTIVAVGALWNAIVNPVIGYYADMVNTRFGKRRPLIFGFSIPLLATMFLLFTNVEIPITVKSIYYGILLMLYWTSYTGFVVPYLALGADYTSDYDDRTVLRLFGSFFNMVGNMITMVMPTMMVGIMENCGMTTAEAWSVTGLSLGIITFVTNMVTVVAARKKDICPKSLSKPKKKGIIKEYLSVATLKPMKPLIWASLLALIGYTMVISNLVYYFTYNMNLSPGEISAAMMARAILGTAFIPIMGKIILKTDRREALIGAYVIGSIGLCIIKFFNLPMDVTMVMYIFFSTVVTSIYWQVMPGIFYDVCEYDRIENGKMRSATIVSFQGLVEAFAAGIGGQLLGIILEISGFVGDSRIQSEAACRWIENSGTIIPVIFFILTCIALYKYPLNKKIYNEMLAKDQEYSL